MFVLNVSFFSEIVMVTIDKSDSRFAVVHFVNHSYDYRPNWTPLGPITIINEGDNVVVWIQ